MGSLIGKALDCGSSRCEFKSRPIPQIMKRRIGRWIEILMISFLVMKSLCVVINKKVFSLSFIWVVSVIDSTIVSKTISKSLNLLQPAIRLPGLLPNSNKKPV